MLDHVDTDECQAHVPDASFQQTTLAKLARTPSSASLNNRLSKDTVLMVQAEQQLLRRAMVTLHVRSAGEKKIKQIHEQIVRMETIVKKSELITQCLHAHLKEEVRSLAIDAKSRNSSKLMKRKCCRSQTRDRDNEGSRRAEINRLVRLNSEEPSEKSVTTRSTGFQMQSDSNTQQHEKQSLRGRKLKPPRSIRRCST